MIEVNQEFVGAVSQELGIRRANLKHQEQKDNGIMQMVFEIPTRALIGLRGLLLTGTKGTIIMHSRPIGYQPLTSEVESSRGGALVATEPGQTRPYALALLEPRGRLFVGPNTEVYQGMIVGENKRSEDLDVNACREKHLTNMRASGSDGSVQLTPFTDLSLEQCLDFIEKDELLEVTPESLRLRKKYLLPHERKRNK